MKTYEMKTDTLLVIANRIIDSVEKALSASLEQSPPDICNNLEGELFYSLSYLRNVFKVATNISLSKYITRRTYTNILLQMKSEEFNTLPLNKEIFGIPNFKRKCLIEFPFLSTIYSPEYMQLPIDKDTLRESLETQLAKKGAEHLMNSHFNNIIKNRNPIIIDDSQINLLIQNKNRILIDLERNYFKFQDNVFKITANISLMQDEIEDSFLSVLFDRPVYPNYSFPADANSVVHATKAFFTNRHIPNYGFTLTLEWTNRSGWGSADLISSITFKGNKLTDIKLVNNPFLLFDNKNVLINLSFFNKIYT